MKKNNLVLGVLVVVVAVLAYMVIDLRRDTTRQSNVFSRDFFAIEQSQAGMRREQSLELMYSMEHLQRQMERDRISDETSRELSGAYR